MGGRSVWHWLKHLAVFLVPLGAYIWSRRRQAKADYRSLRIVWPTLNFFLVMAFVGRPLLEHFKKHQWQSVSVPPALLFALGLFFLVCVYVSVGTSAYYFYRAMRNINFFTQARLLAPSSAWLMVVPLANMLAMPYVWGRTYYCSLALHPMHQVSKQTAGAMSMGAFVL